MNSIGLNSKALFKIGTAEHLSCLYEKLESVYNNNDIPNNLEAMNAEREAVLQAISKMIEENNKAIFEALKNNGIIKDSINP